jgi:hypothetical protein
MGLVTPSTFGMCSLGPVLASLPNLPIVEVLAILIEYVWGCWSPWGGRGDSSLRCVFLCGAWDSIGAQLAAGAG